jgi:hypothetical protein
VLQRVVVVLIELFGRYQLLQVTDRKLHLALYFDAYEWAFRALDFGLQIVPDALLMESMLAVTQCEALVICDQVQAHLALDRRNLD